MEQLTLWPESPMDKLEREVKSLREQSERVRKSQFAKIGTLTKKYDETRHELETLKQALCKNYK